MVYVFNMQLYFMLILYFEFYSDIHFNIFIFNSISIFFDKMFKKINDELRLPIQRGS